jgi:hypothetical protein
VYKTGFRLEAMTLRQKCIAVGLEGAPMNRFMKYLAGFCIALNLAFSAAPAYAQESDRINVTIPFDFVVGNKQLKAGHYVIDSVLDGKALQFRTKDGDVQQTVFTVPIETSRTGNHEGLSFHHYSGQYFLSQVWLSGDQDGRDIVSGVQRNGIGKGQPATDRAIGGQ